MRKVLLAAALSVLLLLLTACSGDKDTPETTAATEGPTDAPYIDTQIDEPEWTLAEGELRLEDKLNIYAEGDDIQCFAIVTYPDTSQELWFLLDDVTTAMLKTQSPDIDYYVTFNGDRIGKATLSDDFTTAIVSSVNADGDITAIASRIRGLSE